MKRILTEEQIERQVEMAIDVVDKSYLKNEITFWKYEKLIAAIHLWAEIEFAESKKMKEQGLA